MDMHEGRAELHAVSLFESAETKSSKLANVIGVARNALFKLRRKRVRLRSILRLSALNPRHSCMITFVGPRI